MRLLEPLDAELWPFDRSDKRGSACRLLARLRRERPDALVVEGTGVYGGAVAMLGARWLGVPYFVSSGDAVGPFIAARHPRLAWLGAVYERQLYRHAAGVIGWTPYIVGRALTLGASRAMTAEGFVGSSWREQSDGLTVRRHMGIGDDALVFGIVGSLNWTPSVSYCYGLELVRARVRATSSLAHVLIVGDGSGRDRLQEEAGPLLDEYIWLPGAVPRDRVPDFLAAMDVVSLPQSVDPVGSFRYTIKLSEYLAAARPVVTSRIPAGYDLDDGWAWRLPGEAPWDEHYIDALAQLMERLDRSEIEAKRTSIVKESRTFDRGRQQRAVAAFVAETLEDSRSAA